MVEVEPLSIEEAETIASVSSVKLTGEGNVKSGAVSDPPKKATAAEVAAETEAIRSAIESASTEGEYEKPPIFLLKRVTLSQQTPMTSSELIVTVLKAP